jgi:hypothetical protein
MRNMQRSEPRGKRLRRVLAVVLAAALAAAALLAVSLGGGPAGPPPARAASVATVHRLLAARLDARGLRVKQLTCLRNGRRYAGVPVVRCNANFGDPHVQAYCSIVRGGRLVTNDDEPALPCEHDDAGFTAPVRVFG